MFSKISDLQDKVIELTKKLIILVEEYLSFDRQSDYFSKTPISYGLSEGAKNVEEALELKNSDVVSCLINNMIDLLKELESYYPKNIKIL